MTPQQEAFLVECCAAAAAAGHVFPQMAACESALESNYGQSELALRGRNLFGEKISHPPTTKTLSLPTREYLNGKWVTVQAQWCVFDTLEDCFRARMALLRRLAPAYPNYALALAATTPEAFVTAVSRTWSSDPRRAGKVLAIYRENGELFV